MTYFVYILRTSANTLYIGQTNNLKKRLQEHHSKTRRSARYIRYFQSFELVYSEKHPTRQAAMKREWQLKKWSRRKKEALISEFQKLKSAIDQESGPDESFKKANHSVHKSLRVLNVINNRTD